MVEEKAVSESRTTMTELVLPNDANTHGSMLGGKVMLLMDLAGGMSAIRHCRKPVVTVSVDALRFLHPVKVGHILTLSAAVTRAYNTSMEVEVLAEAEDPATGARLMTCTAFLTFVALDGHGRPSPVPRLIPETDEERKLYDASLDRRTKRLQHRVG